MTLENNIRFEAAMLPFLAILTLFLFFRHATSTELNRRLRMLSLTALLATAAGIASHVSVAEGMLTGFAQVLLITVYFALVNVNGWYLLRYVATFVEFRNTRFLFFCRLVLYASFAVLIANLPTGFFFSSDEGGALVKGTWYTLFHAGFTFFFIGTAFALKNIYQQFYENAQFILTNLLMFLLLDAFIIQYLFMENILIVYVVSTALLFLTFFYLEAPSLRKLSETEKCGQNEKICYIGQGRFGILYFENPRDQRHFEIRKIIEWESREQTRQWRDEMSGLYSQVE